MKHFRHSIYLLVFCILISQPLQAQEKAKIPVGIAPMEWNSRSANPTYVSMIYDHITYLLSNNSAVTVVDRRGWETIQEEQELLKTEPFILTETIQQGKTLGATKLITGKVYLTDIQSAGNGFEVSFNIYLAIVDVETGVVEDNIMISPRGLENSDKAIEVLRAIRRAQILPQNRFIHRIISIMELFDVLAKYQIGGIDQDDSFEQSLNQLDKALIPFFNYHFNGITDGYTPDKNKKKLRVVDIYNGEEEMGPIKYPIVEQIGDTELRILGGELDGIRPLVRLDVVMEDDFEKTNFNGETTSGVEKTVLGTMSFVRFEGEFSVYSWPKSNDLSLSDALGKRKTDSRVFIVDPDPRNDKAPDDEQKFQVIELVDETKLAIIGSAADGIKKSSRFSAVKEKVVDFTDLNGNLGSAIHREELAAFKFVEDKGDIQIIELLKGETRPLQEIITRPKPTEKIYVLFKLKNY
jgi:hypothetical protein